MPTFLVDLFIIQMDDLISREKAKAEILMLMKDMKLTVGDTTVWKGTTISPTEAVNALREMPPVYAVRRGRWIDGWRDRLDGTRYWYRACSECGYERDDDDTEKDTNYCPNCGADMRGEEDETD